MGLKRPFQRLMSLKICLKYYIYNFLTGQDSTLFFANFEICQHSSRINSSPYKLSSKIALHFLLFFRWLFFFFIIVSTDIIDLNPFSPTPLPLPQSSPPFPPILPSLPPLFPLLIPPFPLPFAPCQWVNFGYFHAPYIRHMRLFTPKSSRAYSRYI